MRARGTAGRSSTQTTPAPSPPRREPGREAIGRQGGKPTAPAVGSVVLLVAAVSLVTAASRLGVLVPRDLAATPTTVGNGELWRILASALVADEPLGISLVSFGVIAGVCLAACGWRVFWVAALVGHVGSTLVIYGLIVAARIVHPGAFEHSLATPDYGVSAMQGAWVGATAAVAWLATKGRPGARTSVAVGVLVLALIGWRLHPDPSVITLEHPVAFLLGVGVLLAARYLATRRPSRPAPASR